MLNALRAKRVILPKEKEIIETKSLQSERMAYLLDKIIVPSLDSKIGIKLKGFLEVMEKSDNVILNSMAKKLGMYINYVCYNYNYMYILDLHIV